MEALLRTLWFEWPMVHVAVVGVDRSDATIPEALASVRKAVDAGTLSEERAQFLKDRYTALHSALVATMEHDKELMSKVRLRGLLTLALDVECNM